MLNIELLQVFCDKTARGLEDLRSHFPEAIEFGGLSQTVDFIDVITRLWTMWNVRGTQHHHRHRIHEMQPYTTTDDTRFLFMESFLKWAECWYAKTKGVKKAPSLTNDTFKALISTLSGVKDLVRYLLTDCGAEYVLTSKISNDVIEGRFGSYRGISGSSYLISVTEVFESQAKLQLSGYLKAHRVLFGTTKFERPSIQKSSDPVSENELISWFRENVSYAVRFPEALNSRENSVLQFIAGYCAFKICRKISCTDCRNLLKMAEEFVYEFEPGAELSLLTRLNRGGLAYPSGFTITVARYCYFVFSILTCADNLDLFLKATDEHRSAVKFLTKDMLQQQCPALMDENCDSCSVSFSGLAKLLITVCTNTLLNGFQRQKNDEISSSKRKLGCAKLTGAKKLKKLKKAE